MKKDKYCYMILMDGVPATFDGEQLCYANKRIKVSDMVRTSRKAEKIIDQSKKWRKEHGYAEDSEYRVLKVVFDLWYEDL